MRDTEMNDWVGGADPELVGQICASILLRHVPIGPGARVLDFGVGIGRVALAVLQQRPELASLTGFDIVPKLVGFCRETLGPHFPNASFELVADQNEHYERFKNDARPKSRADITGEYANSFDAAYAFSVFTHIDVNDFVDVLKFVSGLLKPGGRFMFTAFALTPYSRNQIASKKTTAPFPHNATYEDNGAVFIGNTDDRLAFIGYDIGRLEQMIYEAGLIPSIIEYGEWRGDRLSESFQDVFVCRKPLT